MQFSSVAAYLRPLTAKHWQWKPENPTTKQITEKRVLLHACASKSLDQPRLRTSCEKVIILTSIRYVTGDSDRN